MKSYRSTSFARSAMVGLLAAAHAIACTDDESPNNSVGDGDTSASGGSEQGRGTGGMATNGSGGDVASGGLMNTGGAEGEAGGAPGSAGEGGAGGAAPVEGVLSTEIVPDLTLEDFTDICDEAGGIVETHAVCGGVVTGPGFSYDDATFKLTEHTCAGYNTCSGFSCVIDD